MKRRIVVPLFSTRYLNQKFNLYNDSIDDTKVNVELLPIEHLDSILSTEDITRLPIFQHNNESNIIEPLDKYLVIDLETEDLAENPIMDKISMDIINSLLKSFTIWANGLYLFEHAYILLDGTNIVMETVISNGNLRSYLTKGYFRFTTYHDIYQYSNNRILNTDMPVSYETLVECIYQLETSENSQYKEIMKLALSYLLDTYSYTDSRQPFLALTIIIELLFNKDQNENIQQAVNKLTSLVSKVKIDKSVINENLREIPTVRNKIAHGNMDITDKEIDESYKILFCYIRESIIILLNKRSEINALEYYKSLNEFINDKYASLEVR